MKEITLDELKSIEIDILKYIHDFCKQNGIQYFLMSGTLLGAVRHKGFIPWDDDIDISMKREEYEKFVKIFNNTNSRYKVITCYNNENYYLPFAKVVDNNTLLIENLDKKTNMGVFVDVFPLDTYRAQDIETGTFYKRQLGLIKALTMKTSKLYKYPKTKQPIVFFMKVLTAFLSPNWFARRIDRIAQDKSDKNGELLGCAVTLVYGKKELMDKDIFNDAVEMEFEGHYFCAPQGYKNLLENLYGDYMKLPPLEKRVTHHDFKAYHLVDNMRK